MGNNTILQQRLKYVALIALLIRVALIYIYQHDWSFMNQDENNNYTIAHNYLTGHGYSLWDAATQKWVSTSFHSTFNVFLYIGLQKAGISVTTWVVIIHTLSTLLYIVSIFYFFKLAQIVLDSTYSFWATVLYTFFPATLYYIGPLFAYENIVVPLMMIVIWQLLQMLQLKSKSYYWLTVPVFTTISILIRPNMLLVYGCLFIVFLLISFKKSAQTIAILLLTGVLIIAAHIPTLIKNHQQFGAYILNTQSGFEMLQGHNPTAKGSWRGGWREPGNPLYEFAHSSIPGIDSMNEYMESKARQQLAIRWMKEHPMQELVLNARKVAIYLLPKNYEVMPYSQMLNPINALTYLAGIVGIFLLFVRKEFNKNWLLFLCPLAGSILTSFLYFVGYRWRLYAEPFLCLMAIYTLQVFLNRNKKKDVSNSITNNYTS
jgi:hypothetical protein